MLLKGAVVIYLAVKGFVSPPAAYDPVASANETKGLAIFIVALLAGIFFYFGRRWSRKKDAKGWMIVTILLLAALVASDQGFKHFKAKCTCQYFDQQLLIGNEYSPKGLAEAAKHLGGLPCEEMIMQFGSRYRLIWTENSFNACRRYLTLTYLLTFSVAAMGLLSVIQLVECYASKERKRNSR
jgi:hypothetical protein